MLKFSALVALLSLSSPAFAACTFGETANSRVLRAIVQDEVLRKQVISMLQEHSLDREDLPEVISCGNDNSWKLNLQQFRAKLISRLAE